MFPLDKIIFKKYNIKYISDKLDFKRNINNPEYAKIRRQTRKLRDEIRSLKPGTVLKKKKKNFDN